MEKYYLAIDIGASSGRHIIGSLKDNEIVTEYDENVPGLTRIVNETVENMKKYGKDVTFITVNGMEHCDIGSYPDVKEKYFNAIINSI